MVITAILAEEQSRVAAVERGKWLHRPKERRGWQVAFHMLRGSLLDTNRLVLLLSELLIQGEHAQTLSYMSVSALHIPSLS